jgi:chromosome segregation ATPase
MTEAEDSQFAAEVAAVAREFGDTHSMVADKHFEFGSLLSNRPGEEKRAIWQFESCLSIQRANFGDMTLSVAVTLQKLGLLHSTMGNHKKALSAYYASLERYAHLFGKDTDQIAALLRDIAAVYQALNREDASDSLLAKATQLDEALSSGAPKTQYFIEIYADLADVVAKSGNYAESDGLYRTCIQLATHHQSGREAARYNFKYAKQLEDRFEQDLAEQYYHAAAELANNYAELCLMTAECKYYLGNAAKDQHRLTDASKYIEEAMDLWKKHLGEKSPLIGKCYLKIAQINRQMEEYDQAIYYHEKSIQVLTESSRTPSADCEDLDKIPGLREASSVDFLVHAKGELGITLQRHSEDEARRGGALVTDAVSHLQGKRYAPEHPFVSTLIAARNSWRGDRTINSAFEGDVSLALTAGSVSMMEYSPRENANKPASPMGLTRGTSDLSRGSGVLSRPPTGMILETGSGSGASTPMSVVLPGEELNEFAESQFKEMYGSTGGSIGVLGKPKTVAEMVDSLLMQAGNMLGEGRYVPCEYTMMTCYNAATMGLMLTDPITGTRLTENVTLLNRVILATAESSRRVGHFEVAKNAYIDVMNKRGLHIDSPAKAALNIQRAPFSDDKVGDLEIMLGYVSLLMDQESLLPIGDALDVMSEVLTGLVEGGQVDVFMAPKDTKSSKASPGPSARALSRAGMLYVRVLQVAAAYHLRCGRLVTSCQYLSRGTEIVAGADQATSQLLSLSRILGGKEGDESAETLYQADRVVFLGEYDIIECNFYILKASVYVVLRDFQEAMDCSRRFTSTLQGLAIASSHPMIAAFELLSCDLSLCDGNIADARSHNRKAFSIYSLTYMEDHPSLADTLFQAGEISRIEGKEHKATSTYGTVLEMTTRLRGAGTISEAMVQAAQAANTLSNSSPSPAEFSDAMSLLKAARGSLIQRLPYETHYLILAIDLQALNAMCMQVCGLYALDLNDHNGYLMTSQQLEESYDRILQVARDFFDADYRSIPPTLYAAIITGKAHLLRYLGNHADAEALYGTSTELLRDVYGSDEFVPISDSMLDTALACFDRGKMFPNLGGIVSADVEIKGRMYGKHHPILADSLEALGRILTDYGQFSVDHYTRAQHVLVQSAVIRSHVFGVGSLPVAAAEDALGVLYTRKQKHDDAIAYLNRALSVRILNLGEGHRLVGETHSHLALAYWNIGDLKLCKEHAQQYYDTINGVLAGSHPMVLVASGFYAKVRLAEIKTRLAKVSNEEKEEIEKTYKNCREILVYGCGFERHAWWLMFLSGSKIASPSSTWYELSPIELDDPSTQFKCGSATAVSIAGRLVRADTETNLLQEKHEKLLFEKNELQEKFKEYESTMRIGDVMELAAQNKILNEEIDGLKEKVSTAGSLLVEKDVAELDLMTVYKMHRSEEELHKSELNRLRGAVNQEENSASYVRLPDSEFAARMDQTSVYGMLQEKKDIKDLLTAVDDKNDGLLKTRKALTDELSVIDEGIDKETDFLLSADSDRNELLLHIGAGNVTTLKLATRLGKRRHDLAPSVAIDEAVDICRSTFEEVVNELNRATEKDAAVDMAEQEIIRLKREIDSHQYDLETDIKNMSKKQIAKLRLALFEAEAALTKTEGNVTKWRDERITLSSHVVLLKCKLRDAQALLFILKGVAVGKYESQYMIASSLWDKLYIAGKERDIVQHIINNFENIDTDKSMNQLTAEQDIALSKVKRLMDELKVIELEVPAAGAEVEDDSVVFEGDDLTFAGAASAETDAASVAACKECVAKREADVSGLWADVLGSLAAQEELKNQIATVQSEIGSNEIKMRNLRQSVKIGGGQSPTLVRQESSSSATPKAMGEVNLILDEAEGRKIALRDKTIALNNQLIAICERENMGTLVKSLDPAIVAQSYAKDLGAKLEKLEAEHEELTTKIVRTKASIGQTSKDLHVLEVEISRMEGANKSGSFQSRDPEVTRIVSMLKNKELASIDEVEAEQQAFIDVGIIREREEKLRNDVAVARMELCKTPTGSTSHNKNRLIGLRLDKKLLSTELAAATEVRDEKRKAYSAAKKDRDVVTGDVTMVTANNERASSPLLKERGGAAMAILGKMKSFSDQRVEEMKAAVDVEDEKVYTLLTQIDEIGEAVTIIEAELEDGVEKEKAFHDEASTTTIERDLEDNVKNLEKQYATACTDHAKAQESLVALKSKVELTVKETHELRQKIQDMLAKEKAILMGEGDDKLPKLTEDRNALRKTMNLLTLELMEAQSVEKGVSAELQDARTKHVEVTTALKDSITTSNTTVSTESDLKLLRGRSTKMMTELSTKISSETPQQTMQNTQAQIDDLTHEEEKYLAELEEVERKIDTEQAALTKAVEASRVAKKALEGAEHKFDESNVMEQESIVAVRDLEVQLRDLEENIAIEAENLHNLRLQRRQMANQLNKVDIEVVAVNGEKQRLLSSTEPIGPVEIEECQSRKEKISKEIEVLRAWVFIDEQRRMLEFHPDVKRRLEKDLKEAKDLTVLGLLSMADASNRFEGKLRDAANDIKSRDKRLVDSAENTKDLQRVIDRNAGEQSDLNAQIENLNTLLKKANTKVSMREATIESNNASIDKLNKDLTDLPLWEGRLAESEQKGKEQSEYIEELSQKIHQKEDDIASMKKAAEEKAAELKKSEAVMKDLSKAKAALEGDLFRKTQECDRASDRADKLRAETEEMQAKVVNLEALFSKNEKERSRLGGELSRLEDKVSELKGILGPLEVKDEHSQEEIAKQKHHIERLDEELKAALGMRKSLDPWGFGKEAESGFSRFSTIRNIVEPETLASSWEKDHEAKESMNMQKRAQADPLQPPVGAFEQLNQGAAPVKIFGGVRGLHMEGNQKHLMNSEHQKACTHCGHYPDGSRGHGGSGGHNSRGSNRTSMFLSDHVAIQPAAEASKQPVPRLEGTSPRAEEPAAAASPDNVLGEDNFGQKNARPGKPSGMFPALGGAVVSHSAGGKAGGKSRVKKTFPDKFSKSTPSQLHAAFGSEPFGDLLGTGNDSPNQSIDDGNSLVGPEPKRVKDAGSVGSGSTSRTTKY